VDERKIAEKCRNPKGRGIASRHMLPAAGEEITRSGRQPVSEREFVVARELFDFRQGFALHPKE
jgi:hypothetical protein